jgi:hypothetical protein
MIADRFFFFSGLPVRRRILGECSRVDFNAINFCVVFIFLNKFRELREIPDLRKILRIGSGLPTRGTKTFL